MYRPQIKVLDCTIRDGGLLNNSNFSDDFVKDVYKALCESGVDIIEIGYRNSKKLFSPSEYGPWRFCDDDVLKKLTDGIETESKLSVMMDAHKSDPEDLKPKEQSPVDIVRIATYVRDVDKAIRLSNIANDLGYQTTINIMAISHAIEWELDEALQQINEETNILSCCIVDSFGALYSEDIDFYYYKYRKYIKNAEIAIHCHNNKQLAFANTIEGIIKGANYLDATIFGIGRGAGNCPLELLMTFLKNPKFDIRSILNVIEKRILPLTKELKWGYHIPYMISGVMNLHPDDAIRQVEAKDDDPQKMSYSAFYEKCFDL